MKLIQKIQAERKRKKWLNAKLADLENYHFIVRATK